MNIYANLFISLVSNLIFYLVLFSVLVFIVIMAIWAHKKPIVSGKEGLLNEEVEAMEDFKKSGRVFVHGEIWKAISEKPVKKGDILQIKKIGKRMILYVVKNNEKSKNTVVSE